MVASTRAVGASALLAVPLLSVALVVRHAPFPQDEAVLPGSTRAAAGIGPGVEFHRRRAGPRSMDIASYARHIIECVHQHEAWAAPVAGVHLAGAAGLGGAGGHRRTARRERHPCLVDLDGGRERCGPRGLALLWDWPAP